MSVATQLGLDDPDRGPLAAARRAWRGWAGQHEALGVVAELVDGDERGDAEVGPVRQARHDPGNKKRLVGRCQRGQRIAHDDGEREPKEEPLARPRGAPCGEDGRTDDDAHGIRAECVTGLGDAACRPWAIWGSSPIVTNSVMPIPMPPRIRAMVARRAGGVGRSYGTADIVRVSRGWRGRGT